MSVRLISKLAENSPWALSLSAERMMKLLSMIQNYENANLLNILTEVLHNVINVVLSHIMDLPSCLLLS